jgi:hypothetical protein
MVIKGVNFRSLVFAAFAAGYVMFFVDHWFAGFLGLFGLFPGTSNIWWMIEHHIDSIIISLLFAWPVVHTRLPGRRWLKGLVFGIIWVILYFIVWLIARAAGASMFQQGSMTAAIAISSLLLHTIWGLVLGVLYVPPTSSPTASAGQ